MAYYYWTFILVYLKYIISCFWSAMGNVHTTIPFSKRYFTASFPKSVSPASGFGSPFIFSSFLIDGGIPPWLGAIELSKKWARVIRHNPISYNVSIFFFSVVESIPCPRLWAPSILCRKNSFPLADKLFKLNKVFGNCRIEFFLDCNPYLIFKAIHYFNCLLKRFVWLRPVFCVLFQVFNSIKQPAGGEAGLFPLP